MFKQINASVDEVFDAKKDLIANDILYMVVELNDFVIQRNGKLIPIEVKSADNTRAKSLKIYI